MSRTAWLAAMFRLGWLTVGGWLVLPWFAVYNCTLHACWACSALAQFTDLVRCVCMCELCNSRCQCKVTRRARVYLVTPTDCWRLTVQDSDLVRRRRHGIVTSCYYCAGCAAEAAAVPIKAHYLYSRVIRFSFTFHLTSWFESLLCNEFAFDRTGRTNISQGGL